MQRLVELALATKPCRRPGTPASLIQVPMPEVPQNGVASRWSRVTPIAGSPARLGRLSAQMLLEVGEVSLGGAQFGLGVVEAGLFFADPFDDPRPGESGTRYAGSIGQRLER